MSRGAVERVLNGGHYVSPAAPGGGQRRHPQEQGYVVNRHARSLITGRSDSIGFLLTEPREKFSRPNFNVLLRGCTQALAGHDMPFLLMLAGTEDERRLA